MPIRNMWSLEPGEVLVAERILRSIPHCQIYFPIDDVGIDLLAVRDTHHVGIQVKESRLYTGEESRRQKASHSWHQVSKKNLIQDPKRQLADFFVFLTYYVSENESHRRAKFEYRYLVVSRTRLSKLVNNKECGKKGIYSFYFQFAKGIPIRDIREKPFTEYSDFLEKWCSIFGPS